MRIDPSGADAGYVLGTAEPPIQDVWAEHVPAGGVVWDIGANIGFFTLIAARLVDGGKVVAFEPLPANLEAIRRNVALNGLGNVEIIDVALSDTEGTADLQLHSQKTWAKLDTSSDTGFQQGLQATAHLEVQVSTIDRQLQRLPAPDLVKIDIEGAEVAALRGATVLLTEHRPTIICEFHGTNEAVSELLESHGYTLQTVETPDVHPREARWDAHVLATPSAVS
jgi:FkbM family methyltransferase